MRLMIAHNPHSEKPSELAEALRPDRYDYMDAKLDKRAFAKVREMRGQAVASKNKPITAD